MGSETDRQTDRGNGGQTARDGQMHKQKERQTDGKIGRNTDRQMVKWAGILTDRW